MELLAPMIKILGFVFLCRILWWCYTKFDEQKRNLKCLPIAFIAVTVLVLPGGCTPCVAQGTNPDGSSGFYNPAGNDNGTDLDNLALCVLQQTNPTNGFVYHQLQTNDTINHLCLGQAGDPAYIGAYLPVDTLDEFYSEVPTDMQTYGTPGYSWVTGGIGGGGSALSMQSYGTNVVGEIKMLRYAIVGATASNSDHGILNFPPDDLGDDGSGFWQQETTLLGEAKQTRRDVWRMKELFIGFFGFIAGWALVFPAVSRI